MKLYADKYIIKSDAFPGDNIPRDPLSLKTRVYFDFEEFAKDPTTDANILDENGHEVPAKFDLYRWKSGNNPEFKTLHIKSSFLTPDIYPGEVFNVIMIRAGNDLNSRSQDNSREISIHGLRNPADFGVHDMGINIGGTYCSINHFHTVEDCSVIAYNYLVDLPFNRTPEFSLNDMVGGYTTFVKHPIGRDHSLLVEDLYPGNHYTLLILLGDNKGNWQIYSHVFTTKLRRVNLQLTKLLTEYVGDGDGVGDASIFFSEVILCDLSNIYRQSFFFNLWTANHVAGDSLVLPSYNKVQLPFQKYTPDTHVLLKTAAKESNGLDKSGIANSDYVEGYLLPSTINKPISNGVLTPHFSKGKNENNTVSWSVKAQSEEGRGSLFVYHLFCEIRCDYI